MEQLYLHPFEEMHFDSDSYFMAMIAAIGRAKTSVELESYIFEPDEMGAWMVVALEDAAARGVSVKILVDGFGARHWLADKRNLPKHPHIEIRVWRPILWKKPWGRFFAYTNKRTHRKFCIVDGQLAFVGSQNITRNHLKMFVGEKAWRDLGMEFSGEDIQNLKKGFDYVWERSHSNNSRRRIWPFVLSRLVLGVRKELVQRIDATTKRLWIITPYLSPPRIVMNAMINAKRRGVDVQIVCPKKSDVFFMPLVVTKYFDRLLKAGVRIYEYSPHFIHAKTVGADDWITVGTSNLNARSFFRDFEVDVVVTDPDNKRDWENHFKEYVSQSKEMTRADLSNRWLSKFLGRFFAWMLRDLL